MHKIHFIADDRLLQFFCCGLCRLSLLPDVDFLAFRLATSSVLPPVLPPCLRAVSVSMRLNLSAPVLFKLRVAIRDSHCPLLQLYKSNVALLNTVLKEHIENLNELLVNLRNWNVHSLFSGSLRDPVLRHDLGNALCDNRHTNDPVSILHLWKTQSSLATSVFVSRQGRQPFDQGIEPLVIPPFSVQSEWWELGLASQLAHQRFVANFGLDSKSSVLR